MRIWMAASAALVALAGCGGAQRHPPSAPPVQAWHSVCGRFVQHDVQLRSLVWTSRLHPYVPAQARPAVTRVRADLVTLKPYLTHDERIGLGRYLTGVDSVEIGFDAYRTGDLRGATEDLDDAMGDLDASGLSSLCAVG
jgi:hypothetical protein